VLRKVPYQPSVEACEAQKLPDLHIPGHREFTYGLGFFWRCLYPRPRHYVPEVLKFRLDKHALAGLELQVSSLETLEYVFKVTGVFFYGVPINYDIINKNITLRTDQIS
jgi:hypothetical protein